MPPTTIMLIRHAEKPPHGGGPPSGVRFDGEASLHALIVRGWSRAGALVPYFTAPAPPIAQPSVIYAATPDTAQETSHGARPMQTVTQLATRLGLAINADHAVGDEDALVRAVLSGEGVALICWEHHTIPSFAAQLPGQESFAVAWLDDRFDLVWIFEADGAGYRFSQANQRLLDGDAP